MPTDKRRILRRDEYDDLFGLRGEDNQRAARAFEFAVETRRFEIELYWKRAAYFWAFIAPSFVAYFAVQSGQDLNHRQVLSVAVASIGLVFSFAWTCVNKGSKYWQENWENHIDLLEDNFIGPLYKSVASRAPISAPLWSRVGLALRTRLLLVGPSPFSVTKINQIVSLFMVFLWLGLLLFALWPPAQGASVGWICLLFSALALIACLVVLFSGGTDPLNYGFEVRLRVSEIPKPADDKGDQVTPVDPAPPAPAETGLP